jgi:transcription elongation GreA/GreB family factor
MDKVKVGSTVKILVDNKMEREIVIISKSQYNKIRQGNKKIAANLVVRSSPMGKAIAGKKIGQYGNMKLPNSKHKIEVLGITNSI